MDKDWVAGNCGVESRAGYVIVPILHIPNNKCML